MAPSFYQSIPEVLEQYQRRTLSPVELVSAHLDRIRDVQARLNPFVHIDAESAIARARGAEVAYSGAGHAKLRPLEGIPLTVKSCIDVAGWPAPAGSLTRKDHIPNRNAPIVSRLEEAGAILVGNTNTPEFLMAYETDNLLNHRTSNPWNPAYTAGGSSGGESAAIAAGCSMGGLGSDGGGSIRVPAHFTGICGLKPTPGRVPATGHFPPGLGAFAWIGVVGPMARTVRDLRALFEVISGPDAGDALSAPVPIRYPAESSLRGMRVGILESPALPAPTAETKVAISRAAGLLSQAGFDVQPFELPILEEALSLWWFFFGPVIGGLILRGNAGKESLFGPILREYLASATAEPPVTLESYEGACVRRDTFRERILRKLEQVPLLLSPVSSEPAFRHGEGNYVLGKPHCYRETMRYSQWLNLTGLPGLAVPMGKSSEGLPIGIQLIGRPHEEELLLSVGELLEQARGPWEVPPI